MTYLFKTNEIVELFRSQGFQIITNSCYITMYVTW